MADDAPTDRGFADGGPVLTLPPEEAEAVRAAYAGADVILEYGSGGSTVLAADLPGRSVTSVESDRAWADRLRAFIEGRPRARRVAIHHADVGPTGRWGRPTGHATWARFHRYPLGPWDLPGFEHPDVVLIDGRFRAACFLATLFRITRPVEVLWDDYVDRPAYHAVERYARPTGTRGRLARFSLSPIPIPPGDLSFIMDSFARVQ